jgi:hypothetical protein
LLLVSCVCLFVSQFPDLATTINIVDTAWSILLRFKESSNNFYVKVVKSVVSLQGCAANLLARGSHQQAIFYLSFSFWYLEVGTGISMYGYMCIDILILVYRLYSLMFSVKITKRSDN